MFLLNLFAKHLCQQPGISCSEHGDPYAAMVAGAGPLVMGRDTGAGARGAEAPEAAEGEDAAAEDSSTGCGNSFVGNTSVLMADGTTKPIDQVEVGDKITNAQPDSPTTETDTVTAVHVTYTDRDYDQLTIATPTGPQTVISTAEHLYWDTTTHTWTTADNLNPGDQLDTPGNGHVTILATRHYTALQTTYNLTINHTHTHYVVADETGPRQPVQSAIKWNHEPGDRLEGSCGHGCHVCTRRQRRAIVLPKCGRRNPDRW